MTPSSHVIASCATSAVFAVVTQSWDGTLACFLSGILIDIDHHFDLWINKKKITFHIRYIYQFFEQEQNGKIFLIFHSYELLTIFWLCVIFLHLNIIYWGVAVGITVHIFLDQLVNTVKPFAYFLLYRLKNNFTKQAIYPDKILNRMKP